MTNFISKIGIELEGAWITSPISDTLECHGDGSVHVKPCLCGAVKRGESCISDTCCRYIGECVSIPFDSLEKAINWTSEFYPRKSDKSCGMHIHVSLKDKLSYMRLMNKKFYNYFLTRVTAWGVEKNINEGTIFWERLTGQNTYCMNKFQPEKQYKHRDKSSERRTHLNYCYNVHQTIECRLFPTFQKKELSISAIELYADIINSYLSKRHTEKPLEVTLTDTDQSLVRGTLIVMGDYN